MAAVILDALLGAVHLVIELIGIIGDLVGSWLKVGDGGLKLRSPLRCASVDIELSRIGGNVVVHVCISAVRHRSCARNSQLGYCSLAISYVFL